jgi:hypothetical protein
VLGLKEQLAQTLAAFITSILTEPRKRLDTESAAEPPLRQIIDVLQQVMSSSNRIHLSANSTLFNAIRDKVRRLEFDH